jgi:hypothetical protein
VVGIDDAHLNVGLNRFELEELLQLSSRLVCVGISHLQVLGKSHIASHHHRISKLRSSHAWHGSTELSPTETLTAKSLTWEH